MCIYIGVYAKELLSKRLQFGPLQGCRIANEIEQVQSEIEKR